MEAFSYAASVQMPPVVAAGVDALLHDEERLGVHLLHHLLQRTDLVLAQAHAQHLYLVAGIGAMGRPVRHAAVQLFDDEADQLRIILLGEDQHLHVDVLLVQFIQKQVVQDIVDSGVDGRGGVEQDEETMVSMQKKQKKDQEQKELLNQLKGKENVTKSGQKVNVYANIGNLADVGAVLKNDAGGIGLFRSEFLYLESDTYPTEEQQFAVYKKVAETMAGKKVIIRTLDIGADKQVDYFKLDKEDNPALGYRAIRICLTRPEIFKTQLRALYRASAYGQISIMFPMIISVAEVKKIKEIVEEVKAELRTEGAAFREDVELGIMIETPAAVMVSRELAKEVDFFSVGTNDLTQYTLAIDRQNQKLEDFYDSHHPAVLAMIRMAAESAHAEGKWIGICGELGADVTLTETFLKMGIDELSVAPGMVLKVRQKIREAE